MQAATRCRDAMEGVQTRWTPNGNQIHGPVIEEGFEILVWLASEVAREALHFVGIGAVHCGDLDAGNRPRRSRMGFADVSAADQSDVNGHVGSCPAMGSSNRIREYITHCASAFAPNPGL